MSDQQPSDSRELGPSRSEKELPPDDVSRAIGAPCQETVLGNGSDPTRQLELVKDGHRYLFRYCAGEESGVIDDLVSLAKDPHSPLSMYDAAVLTHQLGQRMGQQIQRLAKS